MNIVIVGNGIIGLSIAHKLLQENKTCRITIIGPAERNGAATPAAAAMLNSFAEVEAGSFATEAGVKNFEMSYLSTRLWPSFEHELIGAAGSRLPKECRKCQVTAGGGCYGAGTFVIHNAVTDSLEDRNFSAVRSALRDFNEPHFIVSPSSIPGYLPAERHRALDAVHIPNEGWLNPKIVLAKLEAILFEHERVTYIDGVVSSLRTNDEGVVASCLTGDREIAADIFVLATGAFLSQVVTDSIFEELILPVFSSVGVSIEVRSELESPITSCIRAPNRGGGCGIYVVPYFRSPDDVPNHYLIGASSVGSISPRFLGRAVSVSHLLESAMLEVNQEFYNAEVVGINVGNRPLSIDGFPVIGRVGETNLYVVSGTKRDGFHNAPVIADYIASLINGLPPEIDLSIFDPTRDPIRVVNVTQAIEDIAQSKMNESYQHGYSPSSVFQHRQTMEYWRSYAAALHEKAGLVTTGIQPQLMGIFSQILNTPSLSKFRRWIRDS